MSFLQKYFFPFIFLFILFGLLNCQRQRDSKVEREIKKQISQLQQEAKEIKKKLSNYNKEKDEWVHKWIPSGKYYIRVAAKINPTNHKGRKRDRRSPPDIYGWIKIGKQRIALSQKNNTYFPYWEISKKVRITGKEKVTVVLKDRALHRHTLIGRCEERVSKFMMLGCHNAGVMIQFIEKKENNPQSLEKELSDPYEKGIYNILIGLNFNLPYLQKSKESKKIQGFIQIGGRKRYFTLDLKPHKKDDIHINSIYLNGNEKFKICLEETSPKKDRRIGCFKGRLRSFNIFAKGKTFIMIAVWPSNFLKGIVQNVAEISESFRKSTKRMTKTLTFIQKAQKEQRKSR